MAEKKKTNKKESIKKDSYYKDKTKYELIKEINKLNKQIERLKSVNNDHKNNEYYKMLYEHKQAEEKLKASKMQLSNALEMAHIGHWEYDVASDLFTFNDQFFKIFHTTVEQVGGYTMHSSEYACRFIHPDDIFLLGEETQKATETTDPNFNRQLEHRVLYPDGTVDYISVRIFIVKDSQGRTIKTFGVNQNITERKQAEAALHESEKQYKELIDGMIETVWIIDFDGNLLDVNRSAVEVLGYSKEELLAIGLFGVDFSLKKEKIKALAQAMPLDKVQIFESTHTTRDGRTFPVEIYSSLITYHGNKAILSIARDITVRKKAEEVITKLNKDLTTRIQERTAELEMKNNELESFSYSVSHDLRAPLRHIYAFSDLLFEEIGSNISDNAKKYINNILNASKKMGALIEDLLSFSKMSRNSIDYRNVNLNDLTEDLITFLSDEIGERDIKWNIKKLPEVKCDLPMIRQVMVNLLQNAVKYTKKVEKAIVDVGYIDNENENIIYVGDNGVGFDEKYKDKLFGVFQRLHSDQDFSGTGIGLAFVKKIINRHGGSVWAESQLNEGATFYFSLPK